ncbi:MAG: DNA-protecting protein DprA [Chitinophagaceae bacterium]|nr:MAG: DNA-protecting protein DprA [Chitinophagaceae bacterium]
MSNDLLYQIALTRVPHIGDIHAKSLIGIYGDAETIFKAPKKELEKMEGIGTVRADSLKKFQQFVDCEPEIAFIEKYKIQPLFITDETYPKRLLNCYDSPVLLYYRGNADLNAAKIVAVVGTRSHSEYGRQVCEKIMEDLGPEHVLVVSGLAFGIDTIAHKAALKNNLPTVGVLAHGLDRIYPHQNKSLAKQMIEHGGLLTDFCSGMKPDKQNFPKRNRIVAGICDALLVIESGKKGGSLITAELGNSYNKDVFAIPGRTIDPKSEGCNYLIQHNKASLVTNASEVLQLMNWTAQPKKQAFQQKQLFIELSNDEKIVVGILQASRQCSIDELFMKAGLSSSSMAAALLNLEMQGVIHALPGKIYRLD